MKKVFIGIILVLILIIILLVFAFLKSNNSSSSASLSGQTSSFSPVSNISNSIPLKNGGGQITVNGWIFCLPRAPGNLGIECAIGIQDANGHNYALVDQNGVPVAPANYTTGSRASISGTLFSGTGFPNGFNPEGIIQISQ